MAAIESEVTSQCAVSFCNRRYYFLELSISAEAARMPTN